MEVLARIGDFGDGVTRLLLAGAGFLLLSSLLRGGRFLLDPDDLRRERLRSLGTWWLLFLGTVVLLVLGRVAVLIAMLVVSLGLLGESLRLTGTGRHFPVAAALTGAFYLGAALGGSLLYTVVLPIVAGCALAAQLLRRPVASRHENVRRTSTGLLLSLTGPVYVVAVAHLPHPPGEPLGWLVLLLLLTELNDIGQAWWGRAFGRRRLAPRLSPAKTWEGLIGGLVTTAAVSVVVAPTITTWGRTLPDAVAGSPPAWSITAALGVVVGVAGVTGDLAASALKRRAGVKDSGRLLPGQGGLLDRFDSLAVSAPLFYALTTLVQRP